jgi:uncharacterized membrane protein
MESINLAHVHLLLNHLPTIGFGLGLCIYVAAYFTNDESLKKAGLILFFLVAVMAIPTFMSGSAAERVVCPEHKCADGATESIIRAHEDSALIALAFMEITGFFAWLALWQLRRSPRLAPWNGTLVLLVSIISFALMALAANEGGEIRHAEIRAASETAAPPAEEGPPVPGIARSIGAAVAGNTGIGWLWPAFETIHFVGLCLLFAVVLVVDLRILGMAKGLAFKSLYQLLPFGMLGFVLNLITGMAFFLAAPGQYINNVEFHRKLVFIILAALNVLYFMLVDETWAMGPDDNAPLKAKVAAASGIFIWVAVLYYGHMLPFLGNAF